MERLLSLAPFSGSTYNEIAGCPAFFVKVVNAMTKNKGLLLIALLLAACILRAPITGVGSLVSTIAADLSLSNTAAGLLTTIPLIAFGVVSVLVGRFAANLGAGHTMICGLVLLCAGILLRSLGGSAGLFFGTAIIGMGIAVGNVLIPAIIKGYYPTHASGMTSLYTTLFSIFAAISSGFSVPLAGRFGWQGALIVWGSLAFLALLFWLPNRDLALAAKMPRDFRPTAITRDTMTWCVALYMGTQSLLFYCFVAWLATILQSNGFSTSIAGYFNAAYMLLGIPGSLVAPLLVGKQRSHSGFGVKLGLLYIAGLVAMLFSTHLPALIFAVACCGFCSGACISFSMMLFGLHTDNAATTSALSGLAQSVGYFFAAIGPTIMGRLYDISGTWNFPLGILVALAVLLTFLGYLVGKEKIIGR